MNEFAPQRLKDETYAEYVVRRKRNNKNIKQYLKGRGFHNATTHGTYRKAKKEVKK